MIRFRRAAQEAAIPTSRRAIHPAWSADRPLPVPSNQWVDSDVTSNGSTPSEPMRVDRAQGGESGTNMRKMYG